jgi:thiol:disulfide interchange protein DsbC
MARASKYLTVWLAFAMVTFAGAEAAQVAPAQPPKAQVRRILTERFPAINISSIDCESIKGLCEVVADDKLFYVDWAARYVVIGRVIDIATKQDLTTARLREFNPALLLDGAARTKVAEGAPHTDNYSTTADKDRSDTPAQPAARKVSLAALSQAGVIEWGDPKGTPITIFTDFRCGFCRALTHELEQMKVRVLERPISTLGSRSIANQVYCAKDRPRAVKAAYAGEPIASDGKCDTSGLDANEHFATANGFDGTPMIVRQDGTVLEGYWPRDYLTHWLEEGK